MNVKAFVAPIAALLWLSSNPAVFEEQLLVEHSLPKMYQIIEGIPRSQDVPPAVGRPGADFAEMKNHVAAIDDLVLPTIDSGSLKLSDFRGRIFVLHFWWSTCAACRSSFRTLRQIRAKYSENQLALVGAAIDTDKGTVERIAKANGLHWPQCANETNWINPLRESQHDYALPGKNFMLPRCWIFDDRSQLTFRVHPKHAEDLINGLLRKDK